MDRYQQAIELHKEKRLDEAVLLYREVLEQRPTQAHAHYLLGCALMDLGQVEVASRHLIKAVVNDSKNSSYHCALGNAQARMGDAELAESSYKMALTLDGTYTEAWVQLAQLWLKQNRSAAASEVFRSILKQKPDNLSAQLGLAEFCRQGGNFKEAIDLLDLAERAHPHDVRVHRLKGLIHQSRSDLRAAAESYARWKELTPDDPEAHFSYGRSLTATGSYQDALSNFLQGHALDPLSRDAHLNIAHTLQKLERHADAVAWYLHVLSADPERVVAYHGLSYSLFKLASKKRPEYLRLARRYAEELLKRQPDLAVAWTGIGTIRLAQHQVEEGLRAFEKSVAIDPDFWSTYSSYLFHLNYDASVSLKALYERHRRWGSFFEEKHLSSALNCSNSRQAERRIRIGFVSADLNYHPVAYFLRPVLQGLRDRYEIHLFSNAPDAKDDEFTTQLQAIAHGFHKISKLSDDDAVSLIKDRQIDILIDLSGHTTNNRLCLFAHKPAPIQVSWLGYPNTTGLETIDYRLSDAIVEPEGEADLYSSEEIIRLPGGFHVYQPFYNFPQVAPLPANENGYVTFGSFNNLKKVTPKVIGVWAKILKRVPSARIFMKDRSLDYPENRARIISLFAAHGVSASRIALLGMIDSNAGHLHLYSKIDIALDPFPYNGTTTTCEALIMGAPVVTLLGMRHAARVSASLLTHAGRPEWIAKDEDQYIRIAAALASDPAALAKARATLRDEMLQSRLCDVAAMTDEFDHALRQMWRKWCNHQNDAETADTALQLPAQ